MKQATRKQWINCSIVTVLYLIFLFWVSSWWGLIVVPFIFDAYITKRIPWNFWKNSKNKTVRTVMGWIDAIVFALIAVYFVNNFFFQNYQIPTSSLEKSLLIGDYLFVSKMSYGPRTPNTPLSMPLAQHTLPVFNCKSYIEFPQWEYKRSAGFGKVKRNDIVVFNFPAGDTVAINYQQKTDFYTLCYMVAQNSMQRVNMDSLTHEQQQAVLNLYYAEGRKIVLANESEFGKIVVRPVDRRENYVKRCIGLPGDTLKIVNGQVYVNDTPLKNPQNMQFNYLVQTTGSYITDEIFEELGVSVPDRNLTDKSEPELKALGFNTANAQGKLNPVYEIPLTMTAYHALAGNKKLTAKIKRSPSGSNEFLYPQNMYTKWTRNNYGPLWIPKKGATIRLTMDNLALYERPIRAYEGNKLEVRNGKIFINGKQADSYTFKMDYYWMMGDNRDNSADSRYWGFVPEDHVVGKPLLVWLSLDQDKGWFSGKIRWNRLFRLVKNM